MNKHKYRAIATAILGIAISFVLWTSCIGKLPLPTIPESTVSLVRGIFDDLSDAFTTSNHIEVKEVTVEDLGTHFVTSVQKTKIHASVITDAVEVEQGTLKEPVVNEDIAEVVHKSPPEEINELTQWELQNAWGISIPSLSVRAPILLPSMRYWSAQQWELLEEQMQIGLNHGAVAYPHSASPGNNGSLIVAGHSSPPDEKARNSAFGSLFAKLPDITIGEEIEVVSGGETVRYKVEAKNVVSPKTTTILEQQNDESVLKLITCFPVGTTRNRMIITAKKI